MVYRSFSVAELMSLAVVVGLVFIWSSGSDGQVYGNYSLKHDNISLRREKRRTQPQNGFFFPIAMYTVRHHRPPNDRGRAVRPETWEYRGQYFYGFRPRPNSGRRRAARLLAAGLPLLLAPLLSILFSFPVVIPVAQMTAVTTGATFPGHYGRRRRRKRSEPPPYSQEKAARLKELEVVTDYLHQVNYDEKQQSRVMVNYLQCNGLLSPEDHCLERLSCEFGDPANEKAPELERTVTSILLGHMLGNEFIPKPFKKRLKAAATHGRHNSGKCNKYFCHYVDNNWDFTSTYPQSSGNPEDIDHGEQEIHPSQG
ncbi:uncharacterized protein LOC129989523 isoform X1 [Argiope bruennichi]|uniref:uncharacterized protein LOC129989523 isoform X1 n=1 Tax=Argiope bruennichi TaxID=94029 RepID=UPI0024953408|nr:uncharacterized protein LOC129989523 isoform X1 [Argiope bruennichi]